MAFLFISSLETRANLPVLRSLASSASMVQCTLSPMDERNLPLNEPSGLMSGVRTKGECYELLTSWKEVISNRTLGVMQGELAIVAELFGSAASEAFSQNSTFSSNT